jgi:GntR family transcriptional regulator
VAVGDPLLLVTRTAYDGTGVPVEFSYDYFRSDRARIRVKSGADRGPDAHVETSPAS